MATPAPRPPSPRPLTVGFAIGIALLVVLVVVIGAAIYYVATARLCHGCGNTPIDEALTLGVGIGTCAAGNETVAWNCSYEFPHATHSVSGVAPLSIWNVNFLVEKSDGRIVNPAFSVTLLTSSGCGLAEYDGSINAWGPAPSSMSCNSTFSNATQLQSGASLAVATIPLGGLPYSGVGDQLLAVGVGVYAGQVSAPFD